MTELEELIQLIAEALRRHGLYRIRQDITDDNILLMDWLDKRIAVEIHVNIVTFEETD